MRKQKHLEGQQPYSILKSQGRALKAEACMHRWLGHGVVAVLTIHGWGFWALWLWEGTYSRGLIWDPYGSNMLSGGLSWFAGAILWVTSLAYVRRHFFEVRAIFRDIA